MNIIILTEFFPKNIGQMFTGGVETRVFHLQQHLAKRHHVEIWSRTSVYSQNSLETLCRRVVYFLNQLVRIFLCSEKADVVEGTNVTTHVLAFLLAKRLNARAVAWFPDVLGTSAMRHVGLASGIVIAIGEWISTKLPWDGVIALSEETKKKLIRAGVKEKKIKVIYGGAHFPRFPHFQKIPNSILCISRLVGYKRVGDLILAVYLLKDRIPDIKLNIVGDGPKKEEYDSRLTIYGLRDTVELLGQVSEKEKWKFLAMSQIHVLPSVVEGFGLTTVEALGAGLPVVNADIPINREILHQRINVSTHQQLIFGGLLYKAGDYVDLAEKIYELLTDHKLYNQKTQEGKELVHQYDWEKVNKETEKFYEHLLSY